MNTKLALSAIVAALMLTACAKQESAAPDQAANPPCSGRHRLFAPPLLLGLRLPARRHPPATPPSLLKALPLAG